MVNKSDIGNSVAASMAEILKKPAFKAVFASGEEREKLLKIAEDVHEEDDKKNPGDNSCNSDEKPASDEKNEDEDNKRCEALISSISNNLIKSSAYLDKLGYSQESLVILSALKRMMVEASKSKNAEKTLEKFNSLSIKIAKKSKDTKPKSSKKKVTKKKVDKKNPKKMTKKEKEELDKKNKRFKKMKDTNESKDKAKMKAMRAKKNKKKASYISDARVVNAFRELDDWSNSPL